jgi:hypothetical protein
MEYEKPGHCLENLQFILNSNLLFLPVTRATIRKVVDLPSAENSFA